MDKITLTQFRTMDALANLGATGPIIQQAIFDAEEHDVPLTVDGRSVTVRYSCIDGYSLTVEPMPHPEMLEFDPEPTEHSHTYFGHYSRRGIREFMRDVQADEMVDATSFLTGVKLDGVDRFQTPKGKWYEVEYDPDGNRYHVEGI